MKEYEYRKIVFYQLNGHKEFDDEHKNFNYSIEELTVVEDAVGYLTDGSKFLRFPGAARATAIAAADFVSRNFDENFYEVLDDQNLMYGNDPFFKRYSEEKEVYDRILLKVGREFINWNSFRMNVTFKILQEEYMLDNKGVETLPRKKKENL